MVRAGNSGLWRRDAGWLNSRDALQRGISVCKGTDGSAKAASLTGRRDLINA
jgi:hypothetical protein